MDLGAIRYFNKPRCRSMLTVTAQATRVSGNPEECPMANRIAGVCAAVLIPFVLSLSAVAAGAENRQAFENGIVKVRSAYPVSETIERIKQDVSSKGIMFFF